MRRVLFEWRGTRIYAYPAMLFVGIYSGVILGTYAAALRGLDARRVFVALLLLVVPALVGARLLFVAFHWRLYVSEPHRIWRRSEGGAALYGGLALAFVSSLPLLKSLKLSVGSFWDAATLTMLTGMIFAKVGCLLNGCCAGRRTTSRFALCLPARQGACAPRIPAQILEAALAAAILLGSVAAWPHFAVSGMLFLCVLGAYGMGRWCLEPAKEKVDRIGPLSLHRTISAALAGFSTLGFLLMLLHKV